MEKNAVSILKKILNILSWIILTLSFILTIIVGIAQISVPGDRTYPIKIGFEKAVLFGYRLLNLDTRYRIDLTELRFVETQKIIKTNRALLGLNNLINQIIETESSISSINNPQKKSQLAFQYITTLTNISYQLEKEKKIISTSKLPGLTANPSLSMPPTTISSSPSSIVTQINSTQEQISSTINRLQQEIIQSNASTESSLIKPTPSENTNQPFTLDQLTDITPTNPPPTKIPPFSPSLKEREPNLSSTSEEEPTPSLIPMEDSIPTPTPFVPSQNEGE